MSAFASPKFPSFASDVADGLSAAKKHVDPSYLYDEVGVALFEAIRMLPEFGIGRAEDRLMRRYAQSIPRLTGTVSLVADLGAGSKQAMSSLVCAYSSQRFTPQVETSGDAIRTLRASDWLVKAMGLLGDRALREPVLVTLLGGVAGALDRAALHQFARGLRGVLRPGDYFLFNVDLVKNPDQILAGYQDAAGVVAAFNKNLLKRINRELGGRFPLEAFEHAAKWNTLRRCVELQLRPLWNLEVFVGALARRFRFSAGEAITTLCDYKYSEMELEEMACRTGFQIAKTWVDIEWAFANVLWTV